MRSFLPVLPFELESAAATAPREGAARTGVLSRLKEKISGETVERGVANVPLPVVKGIGAAGMLLLVGAWLVLRRSKGGGPSPF